MSVAFNAYRPIATSKAHLPRKQIKLIHTLHRLYVACLCIVLELYRLIVNFHLQFLPLLLSSMARFRTSSTWLLVLINIFAVQHHVNGFQTMPKVTNIQKVGLSSRCHSCTSTLQVLPDLMSFDVPSFVQSIIHPTVSSNQFLETVSAVASASEPVEATSLNPLGNDLLIFLCATIGIVPLFKWLNASPVIGFLVAGLLMGPAGLKLFSDLHDMESLADFGVLFLLFEQGLELTLSRLRSVAKYAFGMGTLQVVLSTIAFFVFPFVGGVQFLELFLHSDPAVVDITRFDEALVIGAALSLSSSAFVLKILQEKGQMSSKFGEASLGILLLQDIAVVPLLVLLPIMESGTGSSVAEQAAVLGVTFLKALVGLGGILVIGGKVIRYLFSIIAKTQSSETFVALCLLVAVGVGALTDSLGLSSTLGAFLAGTLLAESNYRTQVETDIKPFKGLLLGLFFLTTGASVDPYVIKEQLPTVLALLAGLITFKATIVACLGPFFNLSKADSVRTGLTLSGGGEFAFVVLTLADKLGVIPEQLAKILVGVVVLSMALTPTLSSLGDKLANIVEDYERKELFANTFPAPNSDENDDNNSNNYSNQEKKSSKVKAETIVICGFSNAGETIAQAINGCSNSLGDDQRRYEYVAFDLDPSIVVSQYRAGKKILYGDGSQSMVLETAGIDNPKAFVVTYSDEETSLKAVERLHECYPSTPIFARYIHFQLHSIIVLLTMVACLFRAGSQHAALELRMAGATSVVTLEREGGLLLSKQLLTKFGFEDDYIKSLLSGVREELQLSETVEYEELLKERYSPTPKKNEPNEVYLRMQNNYKQTVEGAQKNLQNLLYTVTHLSDEEAATQQSSTDDNLGIGTTVCPLPPRSVSSGEDQSVDNSEPANIEFLTARKDKDSSSSSSAAGIISPASPIVRSDSEWRQ